MSFNPRQTYSESDAREQQSIEFIRELLKGAGAYSELKYGDKDANIDGYIQLLDDNRCIVGKLTVQVKTVSPCNEGKYEFPCPTSLFAYAERTIDVVLLMAVDHSKKEVLWKYISRLLIKENLHKSGQETITLHFDNAERLSAINVFETVKRWKSLFLQQKDLIVSAEALKEENEKLRQQLVSIETSAFTIPTSDIVKIQQFSDTYNRLLDRELCYVKKHIYPNTWKQGIAIFEYQDAELCYALYHINYGENSLLIKQVPKEFIRDAKCKMVCHSFKENKIKNDIPSLVKERISYDIHRLFEDYFPIPPYENYIIEYIRDFVVKNHILLGFPVETINDFVALKKIIKHHFPDVRKNPNVVYRGNIFSHIVLVYHYIIYLLNRGYKGDVELYPSKGNYGNTGYVSDWFSPELAFRKTQVVFSYVYATYTDFIRNNFPYIEKDMDMYHNADYVLINLNYEKDWPNLSINYFYRIDTDSSRNGTQVEFSLNQEHLLYKDDSKNLNYTLVGRTINHKGHTYECTDADGFDLHKSLFSDTCLTDTFNEVFKSRLEQYVIDMHINN